MAAFTTAPFDELIAALGSVDVQASMDPADLNLPAAWLALDTVQSANVRGQLELRCRLFLIAPDTDPARAVTLLGDLYDKTTQVLSPDGQVVAQGVVMPGDPTPLPALAVPVYLYTTGE